MKTGGNQSHQIKPMADCHIPESIAVHNLQNTTFQACLTVALYNWRIKCIPSYSKFTFMNSLITQCQSPESQFWPPQIRFRSCGVEVGWGCRHAQICPWKEPHVWHHIGCRSWESVSERLELDCCSVLRRLLDKNRSKYLGLLSCKWRFWRLVGETRGGHKGHSCEGHQWCHCGPRCRCRTTTELFSTSPSCPLVPVGGYRHTDPQVNLPSLHHPIEIPQPASRESSATTLVDHGVVLVQLFLFCSQK